MSDPAPVSVPPPAPVAGRPPTTSTLAVVSLVCGILGWTMLPGLGSIVAIITGHLARSEIRNASPALEGDGLAVAGLVLGYSMIAVAVAAIMMFVVFFGGIFALAAFSGA
ncbi:DUF4190 domain-containing protein [Novilysobacter spongiicola]|uniref:DUF4190 domain-containing protein n=1 Tax=Lysobacter spongiicola DSM 21749 TaxID=1122188 RepID=A0A1T4NSS0_9GAMM|nr:DUF4190 domain-containing protein [Lysobacter spongiicola]MDX1549326.1 DUF4190 domain-containing protein [Lysobacter spongiicola]SJZ82301.1 protein of unknown function [Lysobacter spongiicola DSM 21749]